MCLAERGELGSTRYRSVESKCEKAVVDGIEVHQLSGYRYMVPQPFVIEVGDDEKYTCYSGAGRSQK